MIINLGTDECEADSAVAACPLLSRKSLHNSFST